MGREALAALAALIVYANSLGNGFAYDDVVVVRDDPAIEGAPLAEVFTRPYWPAEHAHRLRPEVTYRPLVTLSYALNRRIFGPGPLSFHLVNILLHAMASALVARLAYRIGRDGRIALLAGLLFAVHPLHTEAVANVVGRAELLAAVLALAALVVHLERTALAPAAIFVLSLGAYLSKEVAITLPLAMVALAKFRNDLRSPRLRADLVAAGLAGLVFFAARTVVLGSPLDPGAEGTYWDGGRPAVRLATALVALGKYALLFLFPRTLSAEYSFDQIPLAAGLGDPRAAAGLVILVLGLLASGFALFGTRRSLAGLGVALGIVAYGTVSNFAFPLNVILAERLFYLPSVGISFAAAAFFAPRLGRLPARGGWVLAGIVLVALGARTVARNPAWASDAALFERTVHDAPRCAKAWAGLGQVRTDQGRFAEARDCFREALSIDPDLYAALDGMGHLALASGEAASPAGRGEALRWFHEAARVRPADPAPLYNGGVTHLAAGDPERAVEAFEAALRLDPGHRLSRDGLAVAWHRLAVDHATGGRLAEAERALVRGIARVRELGGRPGRMEAMLAEVREASRR